MEYYTIRDIMGILKVSEKTARKIANMDGVPTIRIGRAVRIEKTGFEAWCLKHN